MTLGDRDPAGDQGMPTPVSPESTWERALSQKGGQAIKTPQEY